MLTGSFADPAGVRNRNREYPQVVPCDPSTALVFRACLAKLVAFVPNMLPTPARLPASPISIGPTLCSVRDGAPFGIGKIWLTPKGVAKQDP